MHEARTCPPMDGQDLTTCEAAGWTVAQADFWGGTDD